MYGLTDITFFLSFFSFFFGGGGLCPSSNFFSHDISEDGSASGSTAAPGCGNFVLC